MTLDPQTLSSASPAEFVALVQGMSDDEIRADLGGEHREALLDHIFGRFPPSFQADKAGDRAARIDFRVTGGPADSTDTYAVVVADRACTIERAPTAEPDLSLTLGPAELLKLVSGTGNPAMMFMMGKVRARGDLSLAAALATWFAGPKS